MGRKAWRQTSGAEVGDRGKGQEPGREASGNWKKQGNGLSQILQKGMQAYDNLTAAQ